MTRAQPPCCSQVADVDMNGATFLFECAAEGCAHRTTITRCAQNSDKAVSHAGHLMTNLELHPVVPTWHNVPSMDSICRLSISMHLSTLQMFSTAA